MTEDYIRSPSFGEEHNMTYINQQLSNVTQADMTRNFGVMVNTFWLIGTSHKILLGAPARSQIPPEDLNDTQILRNFDAEVGWQKIYIWSLYWCVTLIVCSVLLLLASVAAIVLERRTIGPDFLGFANTAIRKGVKLPKNMIT